ncbi:MAG: SusC/RagA family TonB-linked outer membrane protein [Parabacteroides sp.]|nr:SusC/RagA family TonB-linked outer membrane protein [Parabacteroides sp.]
MKRVFYLMLCLIASINLAMAQTHKITGTVISGDDNEPIIGAAVVVKGTTNGTVTNIDGAFSLNVPNNAKTLEISYVGMKKQEVAVKNGLKIILESDSQNLSEVVVTAMGLTREKKSLGYAIQEVKSEELTKAGALSVTGSLAGKVAGVQINTFGGSVGASSRISLRGNTSLSNDQQPLIVVDGVPIANDTQRSGDNTYNGVDYGSGLNDINPEDIESMTVLKGGSAALYGMRAGNGVILITTKNGRKTNGVTISYDGDITIDRVSTLPKLQNKYGQGYTGSEYYYNLNGGGLTYQEYAQKYGFSYADGQGGGVNDGVDESWGPRLDIGLQLPQFDSPVVNGTRQSTPWISQKNNINQFFQTGYSMNHMVSVLSKSDKASTRVSLSYRDQKGTIPNTDQRRYSGQFNTDVVLNRYVDFNMSANYTRTESNNLPNQGYSGSNPINSLFLWNARQMNMKSLKANWDERDEQGNYTFYNWNSNYHMNPYFDVNENTNSLQRDRVFAKSSLFYKPFDFLKIEGRMGFDFYNARTFERVYFDHDYPNGRFSQSTTKNTELNLDLLATFNKTFGDFNVSAVAGGNYRDLNWAYDNMGASALIMPGVYTMSNKSGDAIATMDHSHIRSNSVYASGSIGWKSQLFLDASARNDWSSTIHNSFFYPSFSLSWIPTESFQSLKGSVLSFLKFRGGWAEVGSATSAYRNRSYYYAQSSTFNGVGLTYKSFQYPNYNLKPEKTRTWEVGTEIGLFDNRLHFDGAYYFKTTKDQILSVTTSNTVGFGSMLINAGEIQGKGIELQLKGDILRNPKGFSWSATWNFSKDWSKVKSLYPELNIKTYGIGWTWGIATQAREGEKWGDLVSDGYYRLGEDDGVKKGDPNYGKILVSDGGLIQSKSAQVIGNVTPDFLTGLRNDFTYKNFTAGFFLDMRIGGDIWSQSMSHGYAAGTAKITAEGDVREHAIVAGVDVLPNLEFVKQNADGSYSKNDIQTDAQTWYESGGVAEMYIFKGSFLKLREAYISYEVPKAWLVKTKYISRANLSLIGSNLALLWVDKSNTMRLDPEAGGVSSDSRGVGFEQAGVPQSRSLGFKVSLTF